MRLITDRRCSDARTGCHGCDNPECNGPHRTECTCQCGVCVGGRLARSLDRATQAMIEASGMDLGEKTAPR
jgi:hypothetical protein